MTARECASAPTARPPLPGELRLIVGERPLSLAEHVSRYGPLPLLAAPGTTDPEGRPTGRPADLISEVERSGLTGRGGGAFPAGRKLRAVAEARSRARSGKGGSAVVVANGSESEPASSKDAVLLTLAPHLVLDGIALCAEAVGADRAYLCVGQAGRTRALAVALAERDRAGLGRVQLEVTDTPDGYLSGQETALISVLNGGAPLPTFVPPRPAEKGAHRRPTLVLNVETLAHIGLIARFGARWFRSAGAPDAPGSALVTVSGSVDRPGVREIPLGAALGEVLRRSGLSSPAQAVLTGGYFGTWLPLPAASGVPVSEPGLRSAGAALGAGVLAVLPDAACGLAETARITAFLSRQSAGQCGPCRNGMPALAEAMNYIAFGRPGREVVGWVQQLTGLLPRRGACHLPDGASGLVASALRVFAADLAEHARSGPCQWAAGAPVLPVPRPALPASGVVR
jgi:NADH:ubiquinone oxidoreductase subunit F (NADH-binding)